MSKYTEKVEKEMKRNAEKLAEIEAEGRLAELLPEGANNPDSIHFANSECPWIVYKVDDLAAAISIIKLFPEPLDMSCIENGCTSISAVDHHGETYQGKPARWELYQGIGIYQHGGSGFYTSTVSFWVTCDSMPLAQIKIDLKALPMKFRSRLHCTYNHYGSPINPEFTEGDLKLYCTERIKFGGGSLDAFDIRHFFSGVECIEDLLTYE